MIKTVYALLVGIDAYRAPIPALRGCVRDIQSINAALGARTAKPDVAFMPLLLLNEAATRQAVIDGFVNHLALAGPNDVALFYYSGHGSQERTPPAFWHLEPDRLDETLVCFDSREPSNYDLADKELAKLLAEVAKQGAHVLVVLDSCHSGSGTRDASTTGIRRLPTDPRERSVDTFLVTPAETEAVGSQGLGADGHVMATQKGRHVLLAACHDCEEARELVIDGQTRGVFSHVLLEAIEQATGTPTYRDLMKRVNALVRLKVPDQYPVIEATHREDLDRPFLGGSLVEHEAYFSVMFDPSDGWVIDAGALHGIPYLVGSETTHLALFNSEQVELRDLARSIGEAEVTATLPARSKVRFALYDGTVPSTTATYKAVVTALPIPPLAFSLSGDTIGVEQIRMVANGSCGDRLLLIREAEANCELAIQCTKQTIRISRAGDVKPLCADVDSYSEAAARTVLARVEHIARWRRVAMLTNPASQLSPDDVQMHVYRLNSDGSIQDPESAHTAGMPQLRFDYQFENGVWTPSRFRLKLVNTSGRRLFCMLLALSQTYGISPDLLPGGGVWLDSKQEAWAFDGQPITAWVPDMLWDSGLTEINDVLKLIVSTEESDVFLLAQNDLDAPYFGTTATRSASLTNTLERIFGRVQTRALGTGPGSFGKVADWRTTELSVVTCKPLQGAELSATTSTLVSPSVRIHAHSRLKAVARLMSLPSASRSAAMAALPPALVDDPSRVQPFDLARARGGDTPLSVLELELSDPEAHVAVSAEEPLIVTVSTELADNEHVLPIGFDGEFYLPLGRALRTQDGLEIRLERLPKAIPTRSLGSAIRILFEKFVNDAMGKEFRYPMLSVVDRSGARTVDVEAIRKRVSSATRILLYVHGIIGDTLGMAASAFVPWGIAAVDGPSIADCYDVVLAFDYENLKTPIEETARDLKKRLEAIGLGANSGKQLDVVAHSMGGLVVRWLIEREGGNAIVQRLVMLGTPNAGSPWSTIEDWATTALALGLNGLTVLAWPAKVIGGLVAAIEYIDVALDEMKPGSQFLRTLNASADAGVPYIIFAGNTSIIPTNNAIDGERCRLISRLLDRVSPQRLLHEVTGMAFFGQPNDIAVSVDSISSVPPGRMNAPDLTEVASDHISYFTTAAVLSALNERLSSPPKS